MVRPAFFRTTSRALVGLMLGAALLGAPAAAAATPTPTPSPTSEASEPATVSATVGSSGNGVLQPGQDLQLSISIRNGTTESITGAQLNVALDSDAIDSRTSLDSWLSGESDALGTTVAQNGDVRLLPSTTVQLTVTVPAAAVPFAAQTVSGTHAVEVSVTNGAGTLATARSSVEWVPAPASGNVGVAIAVPLITPDSSSGLISSDDLADYTTITGTLTRQLDSLWGRPVAIGIDPRILASIRILGSSAPESATQWLSRLETAPNETFALQFGDADLSAQAQSGSTTLLAATGLDYAVQDALFASPSPTATGTASADPSPTATATATDPADPDALPAQPTLESLLAFDYSLTGIGWAPPNTATTADQALYAAHGISTSVVTSANLDLPSGVDTATTTTSGTTSVLIADSALTSAFNAAVTASTDTDWRAAITDYTAQIAQIQRSAAVPTAFVAVDRTAALDGNRLAQTLDAIATLPWNGTAAMVTAMNTERTADVTIVDAPEPTERTDEVARLARRTAEIEQFADVLDEPVLLIGKHRAEQMTLLGVAWNADSTGWDEAVATNREASAAILDAVRIEATTPVLQVSRDSSIPIYVRNDLPWPVMVTLQASTSTAVLDIDEASIEATPIEAGSQARISIPVKARVGTGETIIRLQLFSTHGTAINSPGSVTASVRADWETVGTLVIGIGLVLIFGIGIVRSIRKRRRGDTGDDDEPDPNALLEVQPGIDGEPQSAPHRPTPPVPTPKDPRG